MTIGRAVDWMRSGGAVDAGPAATFTISAVIILAVAGCRGPGKAPPFEWWADPLPEPRPARRIGRIATIAVLVEHTGRRDSFSEFKRLLRVQHRRTRDGHIPGFRETCHYLPKLADVVREEIEDRLTASGWFLLPERKRLKKALATSQAQWLDLRRPVVAAEIGRVCDAEFVLLVEITDCAMKVTEAGKQTIGVKKVGPLRRTDVSISYDIRMIAAESRSVWWQTRLDRRAGYKLEGPGSMGHWYSPRDPMEFRQALRGQGVSEFILKALTGRPTTMPRRILLPGDPRRWDRPSETRP